MQFRPFLFGIIRAVKTIVGFQFHKSFYAIELEHKEFAILTDRAFLPTDGATYNNTVLSQMIAPKVGNGWHLMVLFVCGHRKIDIGLWEGHESEIIEFLSRANTLIKASHRSLPGN